VVNAGPDALHSAGRTDITHIDILPLLAQTGVGRVSMNDVRRHSHVLTSNWSKPTTICRAAAALGHEGAQALRRRADPVLPDNESSVLQP